MAFTRGWIIDASEAPLARGRLNDIVRHLSRQRWRQLLLENTGAALFWALILCIVLLAVIKVTAPDLTAGPAIAAIAGVALAAALIVTWRQRPDPQQVAILADVKLKLKQRLSTAWEFAQRDEDPELAEHLAVQAVNQRYPPRHQPVFSVRASVPIKLLPLAALLLILVSLIEPPQTPQAMAPTVDDVVVAEGKRLREYARRMQTRATREQLPRSSNESENIRRLGARMESGSITRDQSLHRLQNLGQTLSGQRRAALMDAGDMIADPSTRSGEQRNQAARLRAMLEQLLQGQLAPGELNLSAPATGSSLAAMGITPEELQSALENFAAGEPDKLRQMVTELSRAETAAEDAHELGRASARLAEVRENLGDGEAQSEDFMAAGDGDEMPYEDDDVLGSSAPYLRFGEGQTSDSLDDAGLGAGTGSSRRQPPQSIKPGTTSEAVAMRPRSQLGDGANFTTDARILPRAGEPSVAVEPIDPRFKAQLEDVLAQQNYPLHHKEFIRRYFLALSAGSELEQFAEPGRR